MSDVMTAFLEGLAAGYGIAIPVGAVAILIVNTALSRGFRLGFMAGAGAATADLLYAALAVLAGSSLAHALAPLALPVRAVGGLALMALAVWGLWKGRRVPAAPLPEHPSGRAGPIYLQFVGLTLLNPLTIVYFAAYILGRQPAAQGASPAEAAAFVLGAGLASASWQSLLAALGGLARRSVTPRFRTFAVAMGNLIVLALGIRILAQVFLP
jgi:threonine/homoserine/homoserine lactone efflux protein